MTSKTTLLLNPKGHALAILYNAIARVEYEEQTEGKGWPENVEVQVDILLGAIRHVGETFEFSQSCDRVICPECAREVPDTIGSLYPNLHT